MHYITGINDFVDFGRDKNRNKNIDINNVDHNYVQARRVCYFLWLLAALLSAPTLVARVYVEVLKK